MELTQYYNTQLTVCAVVESPRQDRNVNATIMLFCRYLGEVRVLTTSCCITELERLGPALYGALTIAKTFPVYKCGHKVAVPASQCLGDLAAGKPAGREHFIVASQDPELRSVALSRYCHITHYHPPHIWSGCSCSPQSSWQVLAAATVLHRISHSQSSDGVTFCCYQATCQMKAGRSGGRSAATCTAASW